MKPIHTSKSASPKSALDFGGFETKHYVELGRQTNSLIAEGKLSEAREVDELCINLLLVEEAEGGEAIEFKLVSSSEVDTASRSHLRIRANGR